MVTLIGYHYGEPASHPLATFDSKELAENYVRVSRDKCSGGFRRESLLYHYDDCDIDCLEDLPHNPELE